VLPPTYSSWRESAAPATANAAVDPSIASRLSESRRTSKDAKELQMALSAFGSRIASVHSGGSGWLVAVAGSPSLPPTIEKILSTIPIPAH
jgi:hypothetical protein